MSARPSTDDVRTMFEGRYLGAWDLAGRDVTVTIERVEGGVVEGEGGRKDKAPILHFRAASKPMVVNKTNMRTIASITGSFRARDWVGKRITLYATTCKGKAGGMVDCVRVRPTAPRANATEGGASLGTGPVDQDMRARQVEQASGDAARAPGEDEAPSDNADEGRRTSK